MECPTTKIRSGSTAAITDLVQPLRARKGGRRRRRTTFAMVLHPDPAVQGVRSPFSCGSPNTSRSTKVATTVSGSVSASIEVVSMSSSNPSSA